jgi:hypothetical protein
VRNRFRIPRPQQLHLAKSIRAGYAAIDMLDGAAVGDEASLQRVRDLLARVPMTLKEKRVRPLEAAARVTSRQPRQKAMSSTAPLFKFVNMFPRPEVKGIRKVPFLVSANGFPFIRWKKPQPDSLSRVLTNLIRMRLKKWKNFNRVNDYFVPLAEREDEWDEMMENLVEDAKQDPLTKDEDPGFTVTIGDIGERMREQLTEMDETRSEWIEKMNYIVAEEQRLKDKEDAERRHNRGNKVTE